MKSITIEFEKRRNFANCRVQRKMSYEGHTCFVEEHLNRRRYQRMILKIGKETLTGLGLEPETSGLPYQCSSI